jgi:hypothetical protein
VKTGDLISISLINQDGSRRVEAVGTLRIVGARIFADVTPEQTGDALQQTAKIDLVPALIEPSVGDASFRYRGEIRGAVIIPDFLWK